MAEQDAYQAIARNLKDFGYPEVTPTMVEEVADSIRAGKEPAHGVIGMFARRQLADYGVVVESETE